MKKEENAWIDHPVSDTGTFGNESDLTQEIRSSSGERKGFSSGRKSKSNRKSNGSTPELSQNQQWRNQPVNYIKGLGSIIRDENSIWIINPGEVCDET